MTRKSGLPGVLNRVHEKTLFPTQTRRAGRCYPAAYRFVQRYPDWRLVHGELTGWMVDRFGVTYHHAWAVKNDMVYEGLHNRIYDRTFYEDMCRPVVDMEYSAEEARDQAFAEGTYGPWDRSWESSEKS